MKRIIFIVLLAVSCYTAIAQSSNRQFEAGRNALENNDYVTAIKHFTYSLEETPGKEYVPYFFIAVCYTEINEHGKALEAINKSIEGIPRKEKSMQAYAYRLRGISYRELGDTLQAIPDFERAISLNQENYDNAVSDLFSIYLAQKKGKKALELAQKAVETHPTSIYGYTMLSMYFCEQEQYDEALVHINKAIRLEKSNKGLYKYRSEVFYKLKRYHEAADDVVTWLSLEEDLVDDIKWGKDNEEAMTILKAKLKIRQNADSHNFKWPYYLGIVTFAQDDYESAHEYFTEANSIQANAETTYQICNCLWRLNRDEEALRVIENAKKLTAAEAGTGKLDYLRFLLLDKLGRYNDALEQITYLIKQHPNWSYGYSQRAWLYFHNREFKKALDDYDVAIVLSNGQNPHDYLHRGRTYQRLGKTTQAKADFQKVIDMDDNAITNHALPYAYIGLENYTKAIEAIEERIKVEKEEAYYDAACVYSLLNDKTKAIVYLRLALQNGYNDFHHIARDFDLDNIRDTENFKTLIEEFCPTQKASDFSNRNDSSDSTFTTVSIVDEVDESYELSNQQNLQISRAAFSNRIYYVGDAGGTVVATAGINEGSTHQHNADGPGRLSGMNVGGTSHDLNAGRRQIGGRGSNTIQWAANEIFSESGVAVMAQYPGGEAALIAFINKTVVYPQSAIYQNLQGTVNLRFVVEKDGSIGDIRVVKSLSRECDAAAIAALRKAARFTPAKNERGEPVRVWFNFPVKFQIVDNTTDDIRNILAKHNASRKVYYSPSYNEAKSSSSCKIIKVETSSYCTTVEIEYVNNYVSGGWCSIGPNTFLVQSNSQKKMINATGIPLSPFRHSFSKKGEKLRFTLYFPPLNSPNVSFDVIEVTSGSGWEFYNIRLI